MRLSSQNNSFVFNLPYNFISKETATQADKLILKNFIQYDNILDYINSTIKEINLPGLKFDGVEQVLKYGKRFKHKEAQNIHDRSDHNVSITFRSVDNNLNYMLLRQIITEFYLDTSIKNIPFLSVEIIDKNGDLVYTFLLREVLMTGIDDLSLSYSNFELSEQTFTITVEYNFLDIFWNMDGGDKSIYDIDIDFKQLSLDKLANNNPYEK